MQFVYISTYIILGGAEHQRVVTVTSLLIDQLPPYTEYTLYLVAYNEVSASEHSQTITERTGEDGEYY